MSLLSTSHTFSFKRTKNILHTILLSICFVFANSAFATSNPSSSISQNTEVYLVTTDWIDSSSTLIFNPVSEKYFLSKTESSNNSLVFSQPFPNPDTDGDGIEDAIDLDDDNDGISDTVELLSIDAALWLDASDSSTIEENGGKVSQWDDKSTDYWSSSETDRNIAKSVNMSSGIDSNTNKNTQLNVRAIRTFSGGTGLSDPDTGFD